jgi:stage II sporulation protein D
MKGRKQSWVTKIFLLLTLPYLVTVFVNGPEAVAVNKTTDMENILPIILSEQISPEYRIETLEAQAVIARSNLMRKLQEQADTGYILCEISNNIKQKGWVWKMPAMQFPSRMQTQFLLIYYRLPSDSAHILFYPVN